MSLGKRINESTPAKLIERSFDRFNELKGKLPDYSKDRIKANFKELSNRIEALGTQCPPERTPDAIISQYALIRELQAEVQLRLSQAHWPNDLVQKRNKLASLVSKFEMEVEFLSLEAKLQEIDEELGKRPQLYFQFADQVESLREHISQGKSSRFSAFRPTILLTIASGMLNKISSEPVLDQSGLETRLRDQKSRIRSQIDDLDIMIKSYLAIALKLDLSLSEKSTRTIEYLRREYHNRALALEAQSLGQLPVADFCNVARLSVQVNRLMLFVKKYWLRFYLKTILNNQKLLNPNQLRQLSNLKRKLSTVGRVQIDLSSQSNLTQGEVAIENVYKVNNQILSDLFDDITSQLQQTTKTPNPGSQTPNP